MACQYGSEIRRWLLGSATSLFVLCAGIEASRGDDISVPTDPLAKAAFDVLDRSCARCHQQGCLVGRDQPASRFGNILKLDEIGKNRALIVPGNPYGSYIFKRIVDREMPYDVIMEGANKPSPNEADIKALEAWINSLATQAATCEAHKFVSNKDIVALMAADLEKLPRARAIGWRASDWDLVLANDPYAVVIDYDGVIVTDDMQMGALRNHFSPEEAIVLGVKAGLDLFIYSNREHPDPQMPELFHRVVKSAIETGRIAPGRIEEIARRILALKSRLYASL